MSVAAIVAVLVIGTVVGSFTNVIIERLPVPRSEPDEFGSMWSSRSWPEVLGGRSRCSSCRTELTARDLVPVVSWLALRGRCRTCGAPIPAFHPLVEAGVGLTAAFAAWRLGWVGELAIVALFVPIGWALASIDLRCLIVPKALVWPATALVVVTAAVVAVVRADADPVVRGLVGAATLAVPLFVIWFVRPGGMGFGDVRLSVLAGFVVGSTATGDGLTAPLFAALVSLAVASMLGIAIGLPVVALRGMRTRLAFGPPLVVAAYLMAVFSSDLAL